MKAVYIYLAAVLMKRKLVFMTRCWLNKKKIYIYYKQGNAEGWVLPELSLSPRSRRVNNIHQVTSSNVCYARQRNPPRKFKATRGGKVSFRRHTWQRGGVHVSLCSYKHSPADLSCCDSLLGSMQAGSCSRDNNGSLQPAFISMLTQSEAYS